MEYLNRKRLEAISSVAFQIQQPYPWANIEGSLTQGGYESPVSLTTMKLVNHGRN